MRKLALALFLFAAGCGGPEITPPKSAGELTEQEKQQIRELNEQRASEWGTPKPSAQKQVYRK